MINEDLLHITVGENRLSRDDIKESMNKYFLKAEKSLLTAIKLKSDYAEAYAELGDLYFRQDKEYYSQGMEYIQKAIELDPDNIYGYLVLGTAYANQGLYPKAMEHYKKAIIIKSGNSFHEKIAYYNVGSTYGHMDIFPQAINAFRKVIDLDSDYKDAYRAIGDAYYIQKQYLQAIENYQRVVELDPNDEAAKRNLQLARELLHKK